MSLKEQVRIKLGPLAKPKPPMVVPRPPTAFLPEGLPGNDGHISPIIHMAWLGKKPLTELNRRCIQSWRERNRCTFYFWTDADSEPGLKEFYPIRIEEIRPVTGGLMQAATDYGEATDILRLELLRRYGGVWADCDLECLNPIDELATTGMFCGGGGHPGYPQIENAIIGACPEHPLISAMLGSIPFRCAEYPTAQNIYRTGPVYLDQWVHVFMGDKYTAGDGAGIVTVNTVSVHPRSYWYQEEGIEKARRSGAYGYHYWTGAWVK